MDIFLFSTVIILIILWIRDRKKLEAQIKILAEDLNLSKEEVKNLLLKVDDLQELNSSLSKYQGVVDTEMLSIKILEDAQENANSILLRAEEQLEVASIEANEIVQQAKYELDQAKISSKTIKTQANVDANSLRQNAERLLSNATKEAQLVIEQAIVKAKEIAGNAYKSTNRCY
jgi:F0F1-type ATP synthase membrane subunit b/b'